MKKQSNLSRLLEYAGSYKILTYLSWVLSAAGALLALVPFWYIWRILREVIEVAPQYGNAVHVTHYGWMAVLFAVAAVLVYITGLMCSHMAAFRIATNMRIEMTEHISKLPCHWEPSSNSAAASCAAPSQKLPERRKPTLPTNFRTRLRRWRLLRDFWRCC